MADLEGTLSQDVASTKSGWGRVYWSHTKRTALFCCRTWPRPPWAHKPPDGLLAAHERNVAVSLQNAAPTPLGTHEHSRVRFSILTPGQGPQPGSPVGIRKSRPDFATSNSFRKMCILLWAGGRSRGGPFPKMWPPLNRVGAEFIGATRKERPCFAAERGLDRLGHTSLRMVYWRHTKGTALFCCRTRPRPLGHTRALEGPFSDVRIRAPSTKSS